MRKWEQNGKRRAKRPADAKVHYVQIHRKSQAGVDYTHYKEIIIKN